MVAQTQTTLAIIYSHQSALKYVDSCCVLLLSADVSPIAYDVSSLRLATYNVDAK